MDRDTVTALSTPPGRGGIAVIRVSGNKTPDILKQIIERFPEEPVHAKAFHSHILSGEKRVEECVVTLFKAPRSYTGEDLAEISIHSNPFIIETVIELILEHGAKPAMPGEFTFRAFKNGKMDLIQAESVNELINSNSRYYAEMKFGNLDGQLSRLLKGIENNLIDLGVKIETVLEFQDDQRIEEIKFPDNLNNTLKSLEELISNHRMNEVMNRGPRIIIVGKVNVGKSSLFNRILLEDRSITSEEPGTTRDFIKEKIYLNGFLAEITDIAGINAKSENSIEKQGIRRGRDQIEDADIVVFMLDAAAGADKDDMEIYELIRKKKHLLVINKSDISDNNSIAEISAMFPGEKIISVSVLKDINIEKILDYFKEVLEDFKGSGLTIAINLRQKTILKKLIKTIYNIEKAIGNEKVDLEIVAEEIRDAISFIGKLLGETTEEDILNGIFSSFCIGK